MIHYKQQCNKPSKFFTANLLNNLVKNGDLVKTWLFFSFKKISVSEPWLYFDIACYFTLLARKNKVENGYIFSVCVCLSLFIFSTLMDENLAIDDGKHVR